MGMFGPKDGTWWVECPSDKTWNARGHSNFVGGFSMPREAREWIDSEKKRRGIESDNDLPKDLEYGYMKD